MDTTVRSKMIETTQDNLRKIIATGENDTVEFKERLPPTNLLLSQISAFSNSKGGILIIGVNDKGVVTGIQESEVSTTHQRLGKSASMLIGAGYEQGIANIDGKQIVYLVVPPREEESQPVYTPRGKVFVRQGESNIALEPSQIPVMLIPSEMSWVNVSAGKDQHELDEVAQPEETEKGKEDGEIEVFVAMSFREEEEPALVDYYSAIERAASNTKLPISVTRMDLEDGDYEISQQIMIKIDECDVVLADFTLEPRNVYFELGYARGKKKRVIQTARKKTKLEFDIRNWKTVFYRNATELEAALDKEFKAAYKELKK